MFDANDIQATLGQLAKQVFGHVAKSVFEPCQGTAGCKASSPGWTCAFCGHPVCNDHGFATLPTPKSPQPKVICVTCIAPPAEPVSARRKK